MTGEVRCAIYTRKSTNEGLEQEFNSLDAQREACEAYVQSQRGEGWTLLPVRYDDGGFSGGNIERPALTRLIEQVRFGHVDMIVIYKIDRLTRNLSDFAKMMEILEASACSFVSVTQSFNTRTSMGRLTLNMLLSFAQFERELGSERVRDKIAAAKAKGMWTGGVVPLGYDVVDRALVVNEREAHLVRAIMRLYIKLGNVRDLVTELGRRGIVTKTRPDGQGGTPFQKTAIYTLLKNELYLGRTKHREKSYPGRHDAIVGERLWRKVQELLAHNARNRIARTGASDPSLLAGIIFDGVGNRLVADHTSKGSRRYHYYVATSPDSRAPLPDRPRPRMPATRIDAQVRSQLVTYLGDAGARQREWLSSGASIDDAESWTMIYGQLARQAKIADRRRFRTLLDELGARVSLTEESVQLALCGNALEKLRSGRIAVNRAPVKIHGPVQLPKIRSSIYLAIPPLLFVASSSRRQSLTRLLYQAFAARADLFGPHASLSIGRTQRAKAEKLARLSFLAPDIITSILDGKVPEQLTVKRLYELPHLPADWALQRQLLGFGAD